MPGWNSRYIQYSGFQAYPILGFQQDRGLRCVAAGLFFPLFLFYQVGHNSHGIYLLFVFRGLGGLGLDSDLRRTQLRKSALDA